MTSEITGASSTSASALEAYQATAPASTSATPAASPPKTSDSNEPAAVNSVNTELTDLIKNMKDVTTLTKQSKTRTEKTYNSLVKKLAATDKTLAAIEAKIANPKTTEAQLVKLNAQKTKYTEQRDTLDDQITNWDANTTKITTDLATAQQNIDDILFKNIDGTTNKFLIGDSACQGQTGDCYSLAAVESVEEQGDQAAIDRLKNAVTRRADGSVDVKFNKILKDSKGNTINKVIVTNVSASDLEAIQKTGRYARSEGFMNVLERGYAEYRLKAGEAKGSVLTANEGGNASKFLQALGVGKGEFSYLGMDTDAQVEAKLATYTAKTGKLATVDSDSNTSKAVANHAYYLDSYDSNAKIVTLVNPWDNSQKTNFTLAEFRTDFNWIDAADSTISAYA
jgi:hypothetical protein